MAGSSWSIRIAHFKTIRNEAVWSRYLSFNTLMLAKHQCTSTEGTRINTHLMCKRKSKNLVIVNAMNSESEPQSNAAVTTFTERGDVDYVEKDKQVMETNHVSVPDTENGGGGGDGNGKFSGGGGGGSDDSGDDYEEKEFGPILKFGEVIRETEARGASLPADML